MSNYIDFVVDLGRSIKSRYWSNFERILFACVMCLILIGLPLDFTTGTEPRDLSAQKSSTTSESDSTQSEFSATRLYEKAAGYLKGIRGKKTEPRKGVKEKPRYRPVGPISSDDSKLDDQQNLESEIGLAKSRMQRGEWSLAIESLERALEVATRLNSDAISELKSLLEQARLKTSQVVTPSKPVLGEFTNSVGITMVLIRPGTFHMGSSSNQARQMAVDWNITPELINPEQPEHEVRITRPYYIGKYEITVGQFARFVNETGYRTVAENKGWGWAYDPNVNHWVKKEGVSWRNPFGKVSKDYPVTMICHKDAEEFCKWLSSKGERRYFLPTEAQWEFAARGGRKGTRHSWGNNYPDGRKLNLADRRSPVPWADKTIDDGHAKWAPVGSYEPNDLWLYDMMGNVWELCADYFHSRAYNRQANRITEDPEETRRSKTRIVRGGNWAFGAGIARNAFRFGVSPDLCVDISGFRIAAQASDYDPVMSPKDQSTSPEKEMAEKSLDILVDQIKELTSKGRRLEARRLTERFFKSRAKSSDTKDKSQMIVRQLLDSLIDVTKDKTLPVFTNSVGIKMVRIPMGSFVMGSSEADISWAISTLSQGMPVQLENEYPYHKVRISRPFFISATEITVGQFRRFVQETGGQYFNSQEGRFEMKKGSSWRNPGWNILDSQPVVMVSYNDAMAFLDWLTVKEKLPYKLPTEAQWEYAARGGIPMAQFPWGDSLPDGRKANYADRNVDFEWRDRNVDDGYKFVAPVGTYESNGFGLYDMAGNVLEWVRDYYGSDYYRYTPDIDPEGPGHGEFRVTKGGEWTFTAVNLRCAFRGWSAPQLAFDNTGFRVIIDFATSWRPFHFSNDFLTRTWVPGPDQ